MTELLRKVQRIAQVNTSVLIDGESGSGKELVARAVHHYSARQARPWVDVSCAALPENLVESELFGYERGAFSGALNSKPGLFELAHGGTLFLDEIGELPLPVQAKLLRVLDGSPYFRLGGTKKLSVDVRIVAATNRKLKELVREKLFREDLFYRLSQTCVTVPPLRERVDDIVPLAEYFLREVRLGASLTDGTKRSLEAYGWPGNTRELRNVITGAALASDAAEIESIFLALEDSQPENLTAAETRNDEEAESFSGGGLRSLERAAVLATLRNTQGHRQKAAEVLGVSLRTLNRRLREYGKVKTRACAEG